MCSYSQIVCIVHSCSIWRNPTNITIFIIFSNIYATNGYCFIVLSTRNFMPLITAKPYILFAVYLVFAILILIILIKNEITFKKNKNYCFPLDFTIFNLPFINFTAVTIINSSLVNNNILSLIIKITYVICVLIYIILFVWDAITNQNKKKDFRQYIFLTISILMLFAYVLCAVLNFIPSIPQAIELIAGIGGIISLFSLLYQGFRKSSSKIDDKET